MKLFFASLAAVAWAAPPPAAVAPDIDTIGAVRARVKSGPGGGSCRIRGTVSVPTGVLVAEGSNFYVQDGTGGISVLSRQPIEVFRGERVEVEGRFHLAEGTEPEVLAEKVIRLGVGPPPEPRRATIEDAFEGKYAGELIRVRGRVMECDIGATRDVVFLGPAPRLRVYTRRAPAARSEVPERAPAGAEVEVTGVSIVRNGGEHQVRFVSAGDLTLLRAAPLLTARQIALASGGMAALAAIAIVWIHSLRAAVRRQTAQIEKLLAQAEEDSRAKSAFLANVSHEVRTPLNGVLGMLELAVAARDPADQRELLETARASAETLRGLLDAVLDLSKVEAGKLELSPVAFGLRQLIEEAVRVFQGQARQKGLDLEISLDPRLPEVLVGDAQRLRQIVLNLVSNAVKFTERGSVSVRAAPGPATEGGLFVEISVSDTGIGIDRKRLERIFDPFYQADSSRTRRYSGTGLGLAISAHLARLMGGGIQVESEPGKGSVFRFTAPFRLEPEAADGQDPARSAEAPEPSAPKLRILLAEDNAVNQKLVVRLLERRGHAVTVAANGLEAVAAHAAGGYDLILMDLHMPEMDGLEATRRIRERERGSAAHTPVLAMTASTTDADRENCLDAGMDGVLTKPVNVAELIRRVEAAAEAAARG